MATKNVPAKSAKQVPVDWSSLVKKSAAAHQKAAAVMTSGGNMVSFKQGILTIGGVTVPEGYFGAVVLGVQHEYAYYEGKYDPAKPRSPVCYAFGDDEGNLPLAPHEASTKMQDDGKGCATCPWSQWKSSDNGRGKACKQSLKLALVPLSKTPVAEDMERPMYIARVPASSLKNAKAWMDYIGGQESSPFAWVTTIECKPHPVNILTVRLTPEHEVPAILKGGIAARLEEAQKLLNEPYPESEEPAAPAPRAPAGKRKF